MARPHSIPRSPMMWVVLSVILVLGPQGLNAYSSGAPDGADPCDSFRPLHPIPPQETESPYEVIPESTEYTANSSMQVTLQSRDGDAVFLGFLLQARLAFPGQADGDDLIKVGDFVVDGAVGTKSTCQNTGGGALTHTTVHKDARRTSITVTWNAPDIPAGHIQFRATFVQSFTVFWTDVPSVIVYDTDLPLETSSTIASTASSTASSAASSAASSPASSTTTTPTTKPPTLIAPVEDISLSSCGLSKSCYRFPEDCDPSDQCDFIVTWEASGGFDMVAMEMSGNMSSDQQYLAVGMSHDTEMTDASVVDCILNSEGTVTVQMSHNFAEFKFNQALTDPMLGLVEGSLSGSVQDGRLTCRFTRFRSVQSLKDASLMEVEKVFDLDQLYHLLLAKGPVTPGTLSKGRHQQSPLVSTDTVNMTSRTWINIGGTQSYPLVKAHGILMVLAWMVFASFGVLMPRYMKTAWPGKTACGKAIWFQLHQPMMIMAFLLTIAGFVCIFVEARGYSQLSGAMEAHPPLGIIVTALVIINPHMSLLRCAPDHPRRKLFNICHFLVGQLAHILAAATIFLGLYMPKVFLPEWCRWVMGGYLGWHFLIEVFLAIHMHINKRKQGGIIPSQDGNKVEMVHVNGYSSTDKVMPQEDFHDISSNDPGSGFKTFMVTFHLLGVTALAITIAVQIGIA